MLGNSKLSKAKEDATAIITKANASYDEIIQNAEAKAASLLATAEQHKADTEKELEERQLALSTKVDQLAERETEFQEKLSRVESDTVELRKTQAYYAVEAESIIKQKKELELLQSELQAKQKVQADREKEVDQRAKANSLKEAELLEKERRLANLESSLREHRNKLLDLQISIRAGSKGKEEKLAPEEIEVLNKVPEGFVEEELPLEIDIPIKNTFGPIEGDIIKTKQPKMIDRSNHVRLPNSTVGESLDLDLRDYHPSLKSASSITLNQEDIEETVDFGFEILGTRIKGIPAKPGDFNFQLVYTLEDDKTLHKDLTLYLLVNPDPRSMWKDLPTDPKALFQKENTDGKSLLGNGFDFVGASRRGRSHAHKGTFRDDDFELRELDERWTFLAVADGAGSSEYSREASRLLCQTVGDVIARQWQVFAKAVEEKLDNDLSRLSNPLREFKEVVYSEVIGLAIQEATAKLTELSANVESTTIKDFYSTLLFALVAPYEATGAAIISFGIGDGAMAVIANPDSIVTLLNEPDGGDFAGQTIFVTPQILGEENLVWNRIRYHFVENCSMIYLMTDGVSDPKFPADDDLRIQGYWVELETELEGVLTKEPDEAVGELLSWLNFFEKGHHDDRTLVYAKRKAS